MRVEWGLLSLEYNLENTQFPIFLKIHKNLGAKKLYVAAPQFHYFRNSREIIVTASTGIITWDHPPVVKPQSGLAQCEKVAVHNLQG